MKLRCLTLALLLSVCLPTHASDYPDMVGVWTGKIRTLSSGAGLGVARGGAVISEINMKVTIDHQDGETFIGQSRNSGMDRNQRSVPVWGAIRSNGTEALFIGGGGARGSLWFIDENKFEYCLTSLANEVISAYCGVLEKGKE